jgi:hypothetical protein
LSEELPEGLDRVQLGGAGRQEEQGDAVRHLQLARGVPTEPPSPSSASPASGSCSAGAPAIVISHKLPGRTLSHLRCCT